MIHKLPESVINQIAAGEVVENPASVVKELLENSIDAGAKNIRIAIWDGGYSLISIEDDGCGMRREDACLCLERYATSKIKETGDLLNLSTMGFRGEALAAIASISHVELKTSNGIVSTKLTAQAGVIQPPEVCARNRGTTIEVRSLFYNVPARKKFQKSPAASVGQIRKWVEIIAAAHPEIAFIFLNENNLVLDLLATGVKERTDAIFGPFAHDVYGNNPHMAVSGAIGSPGNAKQNRAGQFLYINKRPITSFLISKAVKTAFATRIAESLHPAFVLFLQIDPRFVDFNVHPQKREVRFQEEGRIFCFIQEAVEKAFSPCSFTDSLSFTPTFSFQESFTPAISSVETIPEMDFVYKERPLAILGHFLLVEEKQWILVDLKAAHARVLYESLPSVKYGKNLKKNYSLNEGFLLWQQVQKCKDGHYDPLGNPIFAIIEEKDLAKWIGSKSFKNN